MFLSLHLHLLVTNPDLRPSQIHYNIHYGNLSSFCPQKKDNTGSTPSTSPPCWAFLPSFMTCTEVKLQFITCHCGLDLQQMIDCFVIVSHTHTDTQRHTHSLCTPICWCRNATEQHVSLCVTD